MPVSIDGVRLEPRVRRTDAAEGLRARVRDPLWMLARQWQFGEFQADDAGSPARVDLDGESARLTRYRLGPLVTGEATVYPGRGIPLETLVEREPPAGAGATNVRLLAEAGMQFLRLLDSFGTGAYAPAYRAVYPFAPPLASDDSDGRLFLGLMAGRALDPVRLYASLSAAFGPRGDAPGTLPATPSISATDAPRVTQAARAWLGWYVDQGISQPATLGEGGNSPAWNVERMEYEFAVAARTSQSEVVLAAPEYFEGRLDWSSFVINPSASLGATADTRAFGGRVLPAPVTFRGMPASRFWEFEDARVNLAEKLIQVDENAPGRDDARLLLLEFALVYGNDWFVIPVELEVGSLNRVRSLTVTDTFGVQTAVQHTSVVDGLSAPWRMFSLARDARAAPGVSAPADVFLLAPALGQVQEGPPLEEVLFLRDEMASMGWGVERVVENPLGQPLDRTAAFHRQSPTPPPPPSVPGNGQAPPTWSYRLGSEVPEYWIPFVPADGGFLLRGAIPSRAGLLLRPRGRILEPQRTDMRLFDEEIPNEGARVTRSYQYARWIDGSVHLWLGRRKVPGRGPGSSGLRFDTLEPWQPGLLDAPDLADGAAPMQVGTRATLGRDTLVRRLGG
jgi:hypothetical protein